MKRSLFLLLSFCWFTMKAQDTTYAERLGFPKNARVVILHMDDAGMSLSSDGGIEKVFEKGVANSTSVMMPCAWVPQIVRFIKDHPGIDAGLHLTLTSEWKDYRWVPLAGASVVPGLTDSTGSLWADVADVVKHASAEEVYKEISAQLDRAERMGVPAYAFGFSHGYFVCFTFFPGKIYSAWNRKADTLNVSGWKTCQYSKGNVVDQ